MGKKTGETKVQNQRKASKQSAELQLEQEKKPLYKYVPYKKYMIKKNKTLKTQKKSLIQSIHLDKFLVQNAVKSLKQYVYTKGENNDLFHSEDESFLYLQIVLTEVPEQYSVRPIQIQLPTPIYTQQLNSRFAIICSDPQYSLTEKLQDLNVPMLSEVIGYERLKKNYQQVKDKLSLLSQNDLFFCDWKVYNLLRKPLGKVFYEKKKFPFPIDCQQIPEDLAKQGYNFEKYINNLANYTYFMMGNGPVYTIKVGRMGMNARELVKNVIHGCYNCLSHILSTDISYEKIRQISIKGYNSPSLPIYNYLSQKQITIYQSKHIKHVKESGKKVVVKK